ncbi:Hint domain-containing protein [Maribius pontilimi]|uniref:Hint domain-containing protein n=1 Tax=Palleronia pontilimi TaxID=1964209 RepID=A0A934IEY4_9RHOB|nr:Hint domain-containing protein [Palleronia pontilimi]MBJ3761907.1 Hint domain-containing protein [Palleronia pontilimi]
MSHQQPAHSAQRHAKLDTTEAGLVTGTRVMTLDGMIPVEFLTPGDRIVTRDGGVSVLRGIKVTNHVALSAVTISASVLAHDRPEQDIVVGPDQHILVRGWKARALYGAESALVPASRIADGEHIRQAATPSALRTFQLVFDAAHIIYAEGVELAMTLTTATVVE